MKKKIEMHPKAFAIFILLLSLYLLLFNGVASTDDEQLYMALTESMATGRGYSALPLLGNDRIQGSTGSVEPLHSILGIPFHLIASYLKLGKNQILFILPAVYTALTAALIYRMLSRRGYDERTATFSALAFGLGTIALPYARMHFREPLATLALTASLYFAEKHTDDRNSRYHQLVSAFFLMLMLGAALLTKITTVVILPIFLFTFLVRNKNLFIRPKDKNRWLLIVFPLTLLILVFLIFYFLPAGSLSRFSLRFADYIRYTIPRLPHDHFWQAIAGLLFSPGRGLFIYSPILILSLISPLITKDKKWQTVLTGLVPLLLLSITQALIYNSEWWSITWGTRALLPIIPLLIVSAAPAVDHMFHYRQRWLRILLNGLLIFSILVQVGSLFASDPVYLGWVTQAAGRSIDAAMQWDIAFAPLFRYGWLGMRQLYSDIIWFHLAEINITALLIFIGAAVFSIAAGMRILLGKQYRRRLVGICSAFLVIAVVSLFVIAQNDARYYGNAPSISATRNQICDLTTENDLLLIDHYLHPFWWYYSNFGCSQPTWAGLPYPHQTAIHTEFFYPRLTDTIQITGEWLKTGKVLLVSTLQEEKLSYQQSFPESGFTLTEITDGNLAPFAIYQLKETAP